MRLERPPHHGERVKVLVPVKRVIDFNVKVRVKADGMGIESLVRSVAESIPPPEIEAELLIPYERGDVVAALHAAGAVLSEQFSPEGTRVRARLREDQAGRLEQYRVRNEESREGRTTDR